MLKPCASPKVRKSRPGKLVQLAEHEITSLCVRSREILLEQPMLLELCVPVDPSSPARCAHHTPFR